jgi:hypothetical protein
MGLLSEGPCAESFSHDTAPLVELSPQVHGALGASAFPLKVPVAAGIGTEHCLREHDLRAVGAGRPLSRPGLFENPRRERREVPA